MLLAPVWAADAEPRGEKGMSWVSTGSCLPTMSRFPLLYRVMPDVGAGIHPVDAADAFEAERMLSQRYPGAITASLSPSITDQGEIRR